MTQETQVQGPLAGLRVIEMGSLIAGPFCGQVLGDFGAEVIKLEDPKVGDPMRQWGRSKPKGLSPWWPVIGRNKKSVTVDLRTDEGRDIARALIAKADVVVENFRPGTLETWGMGYEALAKTNPGLVMARVSGFGQTGPYASRAGYALVGEAMGGLRHITGEPDRNPARAGISIGDSLSGLNAALGVMMALHARQRTGRGQVVDAAIYESVLTVMENLITEYDLTGYVRERSGAVLPGIAPSNVYPTKSGELVLIGANQDTLFRRLCDLVIPAAAKRRAGTQGPPHGAWPLGPGQALRAFRDDKNWMSGEAVEGCGSATSSNFTCHPGRSEAESRDPGATALGLAPGRSGGRCRACGRSGRRSPSGRPCRHSRWRTRTGGPRGAAPRRPGPPTGR
jgi:crotonobetainyl-CoA:carnitine CoA-transferase CaiB-like acyl-CoA transferase